MASTAGKWAIGCGIGCLAVLVIVVAIGYGGFLFVKKTVDEAKEIGQSIDAMHEKYGRARDFTPAADGAIAGERMDAFCAARAHMAEKRHGMEEVLATLSSAEDGELQESGGALEKIKAGMGIMPRIMAFIPAQAEALVACDIGPGEYAYIYVIGYYSWLGKSPADGPSFQLTGDSVHYDGRPGTQVREERLARISRHANESLRSMLDNQLAAARAVASPDVAWVGQLEEELQALANDPYRLPWQDGLPPQLESSLTPYREQLEASYSPLVNPLEIELGLH